MAEQSLSDIVIHLISWIESLHEKNLKYEAQVETLSRDLAKAQNSNEQLEARLSAYLINNSQPLQPSAPTSTSIFHQQQVSDETRQSVSTSDQLMSPQHGQQNIIHTQFTSTPNAAGLHQAPGQSQPPQIIYQPIPVAGGPSFVSQPQYVYYDQYGGTSAPSVMAPTAFVHHQRAP